MHRFLPAPVLSNAVAASSSLPSGWFPDPHGRYEHRWFNGHAWTADVSDDGQRYIDPLGAAPAGADLRSTPVGRSNGASTAAITCGAIAMFTTWIPFVVALGLPLALLAIGFGVRGLRNAKGIEHGRASAIAGLVTGTTAVGLSTFGVLASVVFYRFLIPGPVDAEVLSCTATPGTIVVEASITNRGAATKDFTVLGIVEQPVEAGNLVTSVDELAAGATARFTMERSTLSGRSDEQCDVRLVVQGPAPFGLDVELFHG